jgi:hypothetical protein
MGSSEKFSLTWNDFESNVSRSFADLRSNAEFFDVTLSTDDDNSASGVDSLRAHKVNELLLFIISM